MVSYDYEYLERRATIERDHAEHARNPYVKACHARLARRYEQILSSRLAPPDWQQDLVARLGNT